MSANDATPWTALAYQDALRPPAGMRTGWALLTTYSAELRGVAAALLALAGSERDNSGGTAMQLASAVQQLRGRVHVAVQSGRLAPLRGNRQKMAVLMDSFVRQVVRDERHSSWHPKIALMRFDAVEDGGQEPHWRLWVGSRNLTGSENLELGVVLEQASRGGVEIQGLAQDISWLASASGLSSQQTRKELSGLSSVRWLLPEEWKLISIRLHGRGKQVKLPEPPDGVRELAVVSPFVDDTILRDLSGWADDGRRVLISTRDALRKMVVEKPEVLAGWNLYALSRPNYPAEKEADLQDTDQDDASGIEQDETLGWSLHAKLIATFCGNKEIRMWMGSANATSRAWSGRNVECVIDIVARPEIWSGISELIERAEPISIESLQAQLEVPDDAEERLELARKLIAANWDVRLRRDQDIFQAVSAKPLALGDDEIVVRIGLLTRPMVPWPRGETVLELGQVPLAQHTHLVQVCIAIDETSMCWLMHCPTEPELADTRDSAAIAEALRPSELLKLWASELKDIRSEDEGQDWDGAVRGESAGGPAAAEDETLTLEDILKSWGGRKANEFEQIVMRWGAVLCRMKEQPQWIGDRDAERLEALYKLCIRLMENGPQ